MTSVDEENQREIQFLTNELKLSAATISAIYKERWQIELFFKALKQSLKIKTFVGTSANAVRTQIWTALIAMLLIKILQQRSTFAWALNNLIALLRWDLFTYRHLSSRCASTFLAFGSPGGCRSQVSTTVRRSSRGNSKASSLVRQPSSSN